MPTRRFTRRRFRRRRRYSHFRRNFHRRRFIPMIYMPETKYHTVMATSTPDSAGSIVHVTNIANGTDNFERIGNVITSKYLLFRFTITKNNDTSTPTTGVRIMLVMDNWNIGVAPAVGDILENVNVRAPLDSDNTKRFKVMYDYFGVLNSAQYMIGTDTALSIASNRSVARKAYKRFVHRIRYFGVNASDTLSGNIYLLLLSTEPAFAEPTIAWNFRLGFYDN